MGCFQSLGLSKRRPVKYCQEETSFIWTVSGHWTCQGADSAINYQLVCEIIPSHSQLCGYACKVTVFSTKHVQREWLLVTAELRMS